MNDIARSMRNIRKKKGLTFEELSKKTGFSINTLKRIENGSLIPEPEMVDILNKELNLNPIESKCYLERTNLDQEKCSSKAYRRLCSLLGLSVVLSILFMVTFYDKTGWMSKTYLFSDSWPDGTFKSIITNHYVSFGMTQYPILVVITGLIGPSISSFVTIRFLFDSRVAKDTKFYIFLGIGILISVALIVADILYFNALKSLITELLEKNPSSWKIKN